MTLVRCTIFSRMAFLSSSEYFDQFPISSPVLLQPKHTSCESRKQIFIQGDVISDIKVDFIKEYAKIKKPLNPNSPDETTSKPLFTEGRQEERKIFKTK